MVWVTGDSPGCICGCMNMDELHFIGRTFKRHGHRMGEVRVYRGKVRHGVRQSPALTVRPNDFTGEDRSTHTVSCTYHIGGCSALKRVRYVSLYGVMCQ